jgi:hypothetical protein
MLPSFEANFFRILLSSGQTSVFNAMRLVCVVSETTFFIRFVFAVVAIEKFDFRIAFKR